MKSCADAKSAQGAKPTDGNFALTITTPPTAVFCVMGATNVAPKTYLLLNPPVRLICCCGGQIEAHLSPHLTWLLTASMQ